MAINVNTVYQTVLLILNKEQRGYMTPVEFNKIGTQVQLEIFEKYFEDLNQQERIPQTDTDYSSRVLNLDEKISIFKTIGTPTYTSPSFSLPAESGFAQVTETITAVAGIVNYQFATITANELSNGSVQVYFDGVLQAAAAYSIAGTIITLASIPQAGPPIDPATVFVVVTLDDFYRLGGVFYTAGAKPTQELERVTRTDLYHLESSNLTKPTTTYPVYLYENKRLIVSPNTIQSGITVGYIRKPIDPLWNFDYTNNAYVYNPNTSLNFELHDSDQTDIILKILLYAGVVVQSMEIIQVAAQQVQQENNNQKS